MPLTGEAKKKYQREWMAKRRADWMADKPCVECGGKENLNIHHKDKSTKVSHKVWSWAKEKREEELAKCEVKCHRCHIRQHFKAGDIVLPPLETRSILTVSDVLNILDLKKQGLSHRKIAKQVGRGRQTVDDIFSGRTWRTFSGL